MDREEKTERKKNPREGVNPLSAVTFAWLLPTFWNCIKKELEVSDLCRPLKEHTSSILGTNLANAWEKECHAYEKRKFLSEKKESGNKKDDVNKKAKGPSLMKALLRCFGLKIGLYGICLAIGEFALGIVQPIFLSRLLHYFSTEEILKREAYLYATGVVLCSVLVVFFFNLSMMAVRHMGMKMRVACCSLIYRKSLRLSRTAMGKTTIGQLVNLLSNDVNRFDMGIAYFHYIWIGPLQTIIIIYLMYQEMQISAIFGIATFVMLTCLQGYLGNMFATFRMKTALRTDERIRLTNEIISGIQAIKMYTWEKPFSALVARARRREISIIRHSSLIKGLILSFIMFGTRISLFITLLAYILYGHNITATQVYTLSAYYVILRQNMTVFLPQGISLLAEVLVSIKRLQRFMLYEEMDETKEKDNDEKVEPKDSEYNKSDINSITKKRIGAKNNKMETNNCKNDCTLTLENACAKWLPYDKEETLKNININVKPGELIAVVGHVGAGKSSLLNVILKELPLHSGSIQVNASLAYASQEPWLFASSVRQNILFGRKMDQFRYDLVTTVCQLKRDFSLLPYGDKTIVGERGISLSGGQRARINLARAVYSESDMYLLDDPLSAVDAHVGKNMFEECIEKYLSGKTRILVTHQLQYLRNVDRIIVLKDGEIQAEGAYDELATMGVDFGRLLENQPSAEETKSTSDPRSKSNSRTLGITPIRSFMSTPTETQEPVEVAEARTRGKVSGAVYSGYFRAAGPLCVAITVLLLCVLAQALGSAQDYLISLWVNMEEKYVTETPDGLLVNWQGPVSRTVCVYICGVITVLTIVVTLIRSLAFFASCMNASIRLHDRMFQSISRATMLFFNTNMSGRILSRFSKDLGITDEMLPAVFMDCMQIGLIILGTIVVITIANPVLLIPAAGIGVIFFYLRVYYLETSCSVNRLERVTRPPIFGHLSATLRGLPIIRAFAAGEILTKEFDQHQDLHSSAWFLLLATSRGFGFWLDICGVVYILLVTYSFLLQFDNTSDSTLGGSVGLAITQSLSLTRTLQWGMRQSAELDNQLSSVQSVLEYSRVESEPPLESTPDKKPRESWPEEGRIEFKNVMMRYDPEEPPVLKNLNFVIYPREKVGIVGRTGAGKSSLISALFRLANLEGTVEIDGVNTNEIGLHDLRSKISIIPQEPFLFSGSLRKNLDPFDSYDDNMLWQALEEVELKEMGLEAHIDEGGSNLSVGQRQLVCLARAIVRNNPILVLDEATANVDPRTDELIQMTIRRKFEKCTVLTIAHRLNTVMDSDRILLMDAGSAVEFDDPYVLLQNITGALSSMVNETGPAMAEALKEVARKSYQNRSTTPLG